jgi:hypothetical protein
MNPSDKYEQIKDIKHLNPVELEAMVLHHEQQIKDLAAHLLELKQRVTPMIEFKREQPTKISPDYEGYFDEEFILRKEKDGKPWVGLTDDEINSIPFPESGTATLLDIVRIIEATLKEKNGG